MALRLVPDFDPAEDALPALRAARGCGADVLEINYESLHVLNVERNGNIIYTYKDGKGNVVFGLFDCQTRQNEYLYTFEKDLQAVSCSVNSERTLLATSLVQSSKEGKRNELQPGSKCLTLLVEIFPVNYVKVLKAVDSCIWVQFLYPRVTSHPLPQSHLLLVSEEKYIEQYRIHVTQEDENKVVIKDSCRLPRDRIVEDFVWAQWDTPEQRLYYINVKRSRPVLKCIQFNADESFTLMFETPLDIPLSGSEFKLVNFGCGYHEEQEKWSKHLTLYVFTNHTGSLCACYSQKSESWEQVTYSVFYFHEGYRKTFTTAPGSGGSHVTKDITFLNLEWGGALYLLFCFLKFWPGNNQMTEVLPQCPLRSLSASLVLDSASGKLYRAVLDPSGLLQFLRAARLDCERMAVLHCLLACGRPLQPLETQIIQWISENVSTCHSFDLVQEFIIASSYWSVYPEKSNVDTLVQYSSVCAWDREIPGIALVTEEIPLLLMKVNHLHGHDRDCRLLVGVAKAGRLCRTLLGWSGHWSGRRLLDSPGVGDPSPLTALSLRSPQGIPLHDTARLLFGTDFSETGKRRSTAYVRNILNSAIKVISNMEARHPEPRLSPLLQEEDAPQRLLTGLMVSELKDHLLRHLQGVEKKKIEQMVVDYTSKLLDLICCIVETSWRIHNLESWPLQLNGRGSAAEFAVFHIMTRILEATRSVFLPLPPGFHTLHTTLGVHCLPLHSLLNYIDNGILLLTGTVVERLLKDLDNTEKNEKLKFSIIVRLPPLIGQKIYRFWDHPVSANIISRNHVSRLLPNYQKKPWNSTINKSSSSVDFLPLNYLIEILTNLESSNQALRDFEGHDNVDAEFVEEAALKHTTMLLGL
ncbi:gamma-secretase-activating protein [Octodon degus]|uniref:Gamma-secretase-activating protein n=1 Tax=Octodon degus TaxID=10160 RepID=A0A6P6F5S6_OCTDE|nr:gamma-secretase-activating protein [Octodon degus]